jgi:hypothetical protein
VTTPPGNLSAAASGGTLSSAAFNQAMAVMLRDHSNLGLRLVESPYAWATSGFRLSGNFYSMTFANGVPTTQELVDYLYDCLIPYCLPKKKYESVLKSANPMSDYHKIVRLGDEARSLFIKAKNQLTSGGEAGELILYALLEWALGAPRFVSKMYLKTNSNMPVHGTDGIHLGYDPTTELLSVYFGESKIYEKFSDAASAAFSSMSDLIKNSGQISREIELLINLSDLDAISPEHRDRILDYINPYSNSELSLKKKVVHTCFIGFEYYAYNRILNKNPTDVPKLFEYQFQKRIAGACRVIERHYSAILPVTTNLHVFLLPFPSIEDFRSKFYTKIGIEP